MAKLCADQLTKRFDAEGRPAVDSVSLELASGEFVGLLGGSGSGKSTVARMLLGLLAPDEGRVLLDGKDVAQQGRRDRRAMARRIQMVFQDHADSFDPLFSLGSSAVEFGRVAGLSKAEAQARARELFSQVGLAERIFDALPGRVSGGQRQRAAIARALMSDPDFLVCDEITSALDVSSQADVVKVLARIQAQRGMGVLFISHDISLVENVCSRVVVMAHGHVVDQGTVSEVIHHPTDPHTKLLISSIYPLPQATNGGAAHGNA